MARLSVLPPIQPDWPDAARWLTINNSTPLGRAIVMRALRDVGLMETPPGSNRGTSIDLWLRAAGVPESLIESGRGYWCAAWAGAVFRDCKCKVPVGYASCDAWIEHRTSTPVVGSAILYGLNKATGIDAHHIGIVVRVQPMIVTIEGNRAWAGTSNNGVCVDIDPPMRKDILGYIHPVEAS